MNFNYKLESIEEDIKDLQSRFTDLNNTYEACKEFTSIFLNCCEKYGIDVVSIGTRTDKIQRSKSFPFGASGSVFAEGEYNGRPAIWKVVEEIDIGGGAGNTDQYQISDNAQSRLIDGVYELKDNVWNRIE